MTLNRVPEDMRKDIIELQQYYELTKRMESNNKFYYWESRRRSVLSFKTLSIRNKIDKNLDDAEKVIFYMRYIFKYPIMQIVQQTEYSKRMIQYKLNYIIIKLYEGNEMYKYIRKHKLQQYVIKDYIAHKN